MSINNQRRRPTLCGLLSLVVFLALTTFHGRALGGGPVQQSDDISPAKNDAAEARMLQKSVIEQQQQIASLRAEVAALKAQLKSFGLEPQTGDTTRPAVTGKAKRIMFIYGNTSPEVDTEIHKAVTALDSDQWFNAFSLTGNGAAPFGARFVEASDANKRKFQSEYHPSGFSMANFESGLASALQFNPDVIWVVGAPYPSPAENTIIDVLHKVGAAFHGRIDTVGEFAQDNRSLLHMMWRLSHETGGVCVDKDGNPMDEPGLPFSPPAMPPPKPAPQTPSILRDNP